MTQSIQSWIDNPEAWQTCWLGDAQLPGIASVSSVPCGPRLDKQKKRRTEGTKLKDEGMEPAAFTIDLWMVGYHWDGWLEVLPKIHSVKPSGPRQPLQIIHPLPNSMGVSTIYIKKIKPTQPSPRGGFKVSIDVEQWFPEQPETKTKTKTKVASAVSNYYTQPQFEGIAAIEKYAYDKDPFSGTRGDD